MENMDGIKKLVISTISNILSNDHDMIALDMDGEFVDGGHLGTEFEFECKVIARAGEHRLCEYETEIEGTLSCGCVVFHETAEIINENFVIEED